MIIYKIIDNKNNNFYTIDINKKDYYKNKGFKTIKILLNKELLNKIEKIGKNAINTKDYYNKINNLI